MRRKDLEGSGRPPVNLLTTWHRGTAPALHQTRQYTRIAGFYRVLARLKACTRAQRGTASLLLLARIAAGPPPSPLLHLTMDLTHVCDCMYVCMWDETAVA